MSRRPRRWRRHDDGWAEPEGGHRRLRLDRVRRGVYLLPALITLGNFAAGFAAILFAIEGRFTGACHLLMLSMVCDALDGAMARITHTESKFGKEFDSLADVVSFGVAPAIILFVRFGLSTHPYWIFPLFYATAGALRLARYNAMDSDNFDKYFRGTPIPAPAGMIVGLVLALEETPQIVVDKRLLIATILALSYLMVCNVRYPSLRVVYNPQQPHPFRSLVLITLVLVMFSFRFIETWLVLGSLYYLSGPFLGLRSLILRHGQPAGEPAIAAHGAESSPAQSPQ